MNRLAIRAALWTAFGLGSFSDGQIVYPAVKVNPPNNGTIFYRETAIAVSAINPNELVAAAIYDIPFSTRYIAYGVTTSAGSTFVSGQMAPPGPCLGSSTLGDPMTAFSPATGELWVGGLAYATPNWGFFLARKAPGATFLDPVHEAYCTSIPLADKGFMAAGPFGPGAAQRIFVCWYQSATCDLGPGLSSWGVSSADSTGAMPWPSAARVEPDPPGSTTCDFQGSCHAPVVLPTGPNAGRITLAYLNSKPPTSPHDPPTDYLPRVVHSISLGPNLRWAPTPAAINFASGSADQIFALHPKNRPDEFPGTFAVTSYPGIAYDATNPNIVYVIFAGQTGSNSSGNYDLYIGQSTDGGASFPFQNILHLTDYLLGESGPSPVQQFMPWVAVDGYGGVNIVWSQTRDPMGTLNPMIDIFYGRIASYSPTLSQPIFRYRLTPTSFPAGGTPPVLDPTNQALGDYQMIAASGCWVYVCYMSAHEGTYNYYVTKFAVHSECVYNGPQH